MSKPKLTPELVMEMREDRKQGMTYAELAEKYWVTTQTAGRICRGDCWREGTDLMKDARAKARLRPWIRPED